MAFKKKDGKGSKRKLDAPAARSTKAKGTELPSKSLNVDGVLLLKAFQNAITNEELHDRWFSARDWCSVLPEYHGVLKGFEEQITTKKFTKVMNKIAHRLYTEESSSGIYGNKHGDNWYYMYTKDVRCPKPPTIDGFYPSNMKDFDTRQAVENTSTASSQSQSNNNNNEQAKKSEEVRRQTCFDQKEVFKIFMPKGTKFEDYDDPGKACLEAMAERRHTCHQGWHAGWHTAVHGGEKHKDDASTFEQKKISMKCMYVNLALTYAMDRRYTWGLTSWAKCCEDAITFLSSDILGFEYIENERTIRDWHIQIRDSNNKFPHPNPLVAAKAAAAGDYDSGDDDDDITNDEDEVVLPPFFVEFPDALQGFYNHADGLADKDELCCEAMDEYVNDELIPKLVDKHNDGLPEGEKRTRLEFLKSLGFLRQKEEEDVENAKISRSSINRWMTKLGYGWSRRIKSSYNSTHEHPTTKAYRADYILRYFFKYETRAHRWIQVAKVDADQMKEDRCVPKETGVEYETSNGNKMVEFHVDDCPTFGKIMDRDTSFGGKLSVVFLNAPTRLMKELSTMKLFATEVGNYEYVKDGESWTEAHASQFKDTQSQELRTFMQNNNLVFGPSARVPLLIFGQDEAIMKQYLTSPFHWVKRDGQRAMSPKDDGLGLMASSFKSREFGFGFRDMTAEDFEKVNKFRKDHRPKYQDDIAATFVLGSPFKPDLSESPFHKLFEYGAQAEGYWSYNKMVVQLEDIIDCLDALYSIPRADLTEEDQQLPDVPLTTTLKRQYEYVFQFDHSNGHDKKQPNGLNMKDMRVHISATARHMRSVLITEDVPLGPFHHPKKLKVGDTQHMQFRELDNHNNEETGPARGGHPKFDVFGDEEEKERTMPELQVDLQLRGLDFKGRKAQLVERCNRAQPPIPVTKMERKLVTTGWIDKPKGTLQVLWERGWIDPTDLNKYTQKGKKGGVTDLNNSLDYLMSLQSDFVNEKTMLQFIGEKLGCIIDRTPKCHPEMAGDGIEYEWAMAKLWYRRQKMERKKGKDKFHALVKECFGRDILSIERSRKFSRRARQYMVSYYMLEKDGKSTTPMDVKNYKKLRKSHTDVLKEDYGYMSECLRQVATEQSNNSSNA